VNRLSIHPDAVKRLNTGNNNGSVGYAGDGLSAEVSQQASLNTRSCLVAVSYYESLSHYLKYNLLPAGFFVKKKNGNAQPATELLLENRVIAID
jgi:hypothetical protein